MSDMDIEITEVSVEAEVTCNHCGGTHFISVNDGDTYFSESQMADAVTERLSDEGWDDELCPDCVWDRDHPEEDN
jgi:hypothetical protein